MKEHVDEFERFKQVIRGFDENLQQRAMKTEMTKIELELRNYVKSKDYNKDQKSVNKKMDRMDDRIDEINTQLTQIQYSVSAQIKDSENVLKKKLEKRMEVRLSNLPGYHAETVGEAVTGIKNQ